MASSFAGEANRPCVVEAHPLRTERSEQLIHRAFAGRLIEKIAVPYFDGVLEFLWQRTQVSFERRQFPRTEGLVHLQEKRPSRPPKGATRPKNSRVSASPPTSRRSWLIAWGNLKQNRKSAGASAHHFCTVPADGSP
ncbi:MAG: hypothetical protein WDM96_07535 [Lacunisphaera sp.]